MTQLALSLTCISQKIALKIGASPVVTLGDHPEPHCAICEVTAYIAQGGSTISMLNNQQVICIVSAPLCTENAVRDCDAIKRTEFPLTCPGFSLHPA
jgi:hypothetical protein